MTSIAGKLIRGSLIQTLMPVSNVIVTFFMMPFVIGNLGDRWYGLWILAAAFVGYYGLLDLGLSRANERFISRALGRGEKAISNIIFNTCLLLFSAAAILTIIASFIVVIATPHFVQSADDLKIFRIVTMVVGVTVAIAYPIRAFTGFLYAHVRHDVCSIVEIAKLAVRTVLIVFFIGRGHGIIALALISFAVETAQCIFTIYYVMTNYPELAISARLFDRKWVRPLLGYSIYSFIATIGDRLQFHLDAFVITAYLGLSMVTHYNIGARIANYYLLLITSAIALVMPVFSRLEGQNDFQGIRRNYILVSKLNTILAVLMGGSLIIFGRAFLLRWMGPQYGDSYKILVILIIGLAVNAIQITSKSLLFGLSKHKMFALMVAAEGVANLVLSLILVRKLGIFGVALGTTIPTLITNCCILPTYTNRVIGMKTSKYARIIMGAVLLGVAIHAANWFAIRDMMLVSYRNMLLLGLATSSIFLAINALVVLSKAERRRFGIPF